MLGVQERESYDLGFCCVASTFCVAFNKLSNHALSLSVPHLQNGDERVLLLRMAPSSVLNLEYMPALGPLGCLVSRLGPVCFGTQTCCLGGLYSCRETAFGCLMRFCFIQYVYFVWM